MNRMFMLLMLAGTFFTAISQVLLKQSANKKYSNPLLEYLNWRVIVAYGIFFGVLLLNTWCYTKVDMRFGPVIDTAAYVFVLIFSRLILNEKITKGKLVGNLLIAGLPYEDYDSFGKSFCDVYRLRPQQLQLGFLKVLKGSFMYQAAPEYGCVCPGDSPENGFCSGIRGGDTGAGRA